MSNSLKKAKNSQQLIDRFGRQIDYVRISITDRCDFRCVYCMSETMTFLPRAQILSLEEIYTIAAAFVDLGVQRIRITGGEPLVRKGALDLIKQLGQLSELQELTLTTNGSKLAANAALLRAAGVNRINVSLDTLDAVKFRQITRTGDLNEVIKGLDTAIKTGFERLKINAVILQNRNHEEVSALVKLAVDKGIDISFIEEMPLGVIDDHNREEAYYPSDSIKQDLAAKFSLIPSTETTGGPSRYFSIANTQTRVGFISPHSHNFCSTCNRVRLTVEGRLLLCLGNEHSIDLKQVIRANPGDTELLKKTIIEAMKIKPEKHEFKLHEKPVILRHMNVTGG